MAKVLPKHAREELVTEENMDRACRYQQRLYTGAIRTDSEAGHDGHQSPNASFRAARSHKAKVKREYRELGEAFDELIGKVRHIQPLQALGDVVVMDTPHVFAEA
jgi:hypothetical protein